MSTLLPLASGLRTVRGLEMRDVTTLTMLGHRKGDAPHFCHTLSRRVSK